MEKNRIIDEENSKTYFPKGVSFRINEFVNISEIFECTGLTYERLGEKVNLSVFDPEKSNKSKDTKFSEDKKIRDTQMLDLEDIASEIIDLYDLLR